MRTSELRLLVSVPGASCRSSKIVEVPSWAANCRAVASPTTPAPITWKCKLAGCWLFRYYLTACVKSALAVRVLEKKRRLVSLTICLNARADISAESAIEQQLTVTTYICTYVGVCMVLIRRMTRSRGRIALSM